MVAAKDNSLQAKRLKTLGNRYWRLNHLYYILDEKGNKMLFKMNPVQVALYFALHYLNIIPKSRQHGMTTFIAIFMLDACLFNSNIRAGIVAHKLADAKKIFRDKVKYAYDRLPSDLISALPLIKDDSQELIFGNNSGIYVGTSMRSGTLQYLHVSEYGWICTHAPAKASEIKAGAMETVHEDGMIFIESTAEGPVGDFPDMCDDAEQVMLSGRELGPMDYKLHFFAWHEKASNVTDPKFVEIDDKADEYFDKLEAIYSKKIDGTQRAWYTAKKKQLKHLIYKEHPSTLEEAFLAAIEGSYYAQEISQAREQGRICSVRHNPALPVFTVSDIGIGINTPWIFFQVDGDDINIIDYFCLDKKDDVRAGMAFYKSMLDAKKEQFGYNYGKYFGPFDLGKEESGTGISIYNTAKQHGIVFEKLKCERLVLDGIERVTNMFPRLRIDSAKCKVLVNGIASYRREWIESAGMYAERPVHDSASHPADALRYLSMVIEQRLYEMIVSNSISSDKIAELTRQYARTG